MQGALIVILLVMNTFFSSFNNVDLSHIMLVDCCMLEFVAGSVAP